MNTEFTHLGSFIVQALASMSMHIKADKEKKQKVPHKNNYWLQLRRWHCDTGKYTQPSRNTTA